MQLCRRREAASARNRRHARGACERVNERGGTALLFPTAVHGYTPPDRKTDSLIALAFMILVAGTTSAVHFAQLTALRQLGAAGIVWPSPAYAVELLAWNFFLGLSLLFAAPVFDHGGLERRIRRGLLVSAVLCLAGVIGPAVGNMRLQLIGVLGYAGVLPVVCFMLSRLFRSDPRPRTTPASKWHGR